MYHVDANTNVNERQSLVWEELSRGQRSKMRAGHSYEAQQPTFGQSALQSRRRAWTWPVVVGAPLVAAVIITLAIAF